MLSLSVLPSTTAKLKPSALTVHFFHNASLTNQKRPAVSQQVFRLNPMYRHHLPSDSAVSVSAPAEAP